MRQRNTKTKWLTVEDDLLRRLWSERADIPWVALQMGRSQVSVRHRLATLGMSIIRSRGVEWTAEECERVRLLHGEGKKAPEISAEIGRSAHAVARQLTKLGLGGGGSARWTDHDIATLTRMHKEGCAGAEIAEKLDRPKGGVYWQFIQLGLKRYNKTPPVNATPDLPSWEELSDAIARWGVAGAAEEYEVSPAEIMRWRLQLCGGK